MSEAFSCRSSVSSCSSVTSLSFQGHQRHPSLQVLFASLLTPNLPASTTVLGSTPTRCPAAVAPLPLFSFLPGAGSVLALVLPLYGNSEVPELSDRAMRGKVQAHSLASPVKSKPCTRALFQRASCGGKQGGCVRGQGLGLDPGSSSPSPPRLDMAAWAPAFARQSSDWARHCRSRKRECVV